MVQKVNSRLDGKSTRYIHIEFMLDRIDFEFPLIISSEQIQMSTKERTFFYYWNNDSHSYKYTRSEQTIEWIKKIIYINRWFYELSWSISLLKWLHSDTISNNFALYQAKRFIYNSDIVVKTLPKSILFSLNLCNKSRNLWNF